ncbi:unnamed protein product [Caenorhabditis angaria]|uniref:Major facilitator superfamily (MFS) profile domain-containing protein n=1 Tax=Caenorhabditis angaria TaxID=860376 RepID=A0A9P1IEW6_9PELO|nr:unnamed protein product [Caenorhabditis angaria]
MGIGIPLAIIALDAIYSKCLGNINQSVMQGAMIVAEDVITIVGPIYTSYIFTSYGFGALWMFNGIVVTLGTLLWLLNIRKLEKYS